MAIVRGVCDRCKNRETCKRPCVFLEKMLSEETPQASRVMEKTFDKIIVSFPARSQIRFTELEGGRQGDDGNSQDLTPDDFDAAGPLPWSKSDFKLRKTTVFVERFFNRVPCKVLAENFDVEKNTVVSMYKQAVEQLEKTIDQMDARRGGIKSVMQMTKLSEYQKWFLLVHVFGFSCVEVANMFKKNCKVVHNHVKAMHDDFMNRFEKKEVADMPIDKLTTPTIIETVEKYAEQGLSLRQAFGRIARTYSEVTGQNIGLRTIESRYYKGVRRQEQCAIPA